MVVSGLPQPNPQPLPRPEAAAVPEHPQQPAVPLRAGDEEDRPDGGADDQGRVEEDRQRAQQQVGIEQIIIFGAKNIQSKISTQVDSRPAAIKAIEAPPVHDNASQCGTNTGGDRVIH